ncbi:MAG: UDP-N-acetylmuramoyl-tripeptide--D-alanyl-D-alanine ligase [Halothiobacillaceae bacterium]|nr:MAG: UDP-N-acetylmuramoyl-tripeptide--D-alanyl-D-alanine ligase [Halothiobacillaceae bacterium]
MLNMTLAQVAEAVQGKLHGPAGMSVRGLFTDTRKPVAGALFVALRGPRFDAHDFVGTAVAGGASAALVERRLDADIPQVVVEDARLALGKVAAAWRARWNGRLIGLTGSNGKTSTKEMLASILRLQGGTLATRGNLNNDIGVPLMLAELDASQSFAVIEMGANHPGEIATLTALAQPDVALITNTGRAHLEGFGGPEGVIRAKGEIYGGLREGGVALVSADDAGAACWQALNQDRAMLTFGMTRPADIQGRWQASAAGGRLRIMAPAGEVEIELRVAGEHNGRNALAAASAALALGIGLSVIKAGLEAFAGVPGRLQRKPGRNGSTLWDDSYNANPDSLRAGIQAVINAVGSPQGDTRRAEARDGFRRDQGGETWLVLGDMGELGPGSAGLHAESGRVARELGVARLFAVGGLAAHAVEAFGHGARHVDDIETLVAALRAELRPGIHILIKGSRSSRMERVTQALEEPSC